MKYIRYIKYYSGLLLALVLLLSSESISAQPNPGAQQTSPDVRAKASDLENRYEVIIRNSLREYFPEPTFVVDARISLSKVRFPKELKKQKTFKRPLSVDQLPGLPVLPEGFSRSMDQGDTLKPSEVKIGYRVNNIIASVMVDTSYSPDNISFVEELVRSAARIETERGDEVIIRETAFPRSINTEALSQQSRSDSPSQEAEPDTSMAASSTDQGVVQKYLPYILIGLGVLLLLLFALMLWINRRTRKSMEEQIPSSEELKSSLRDEIEQMKSEQAEAAENGEPTDEQKEQFERDRTYVTTQFISHPEKVGELLEDWIQSDEDDGAWKAAKTIKASNSNLLSTLKPVLKKRHYQSLQHAIDDLEPLSFQDKRNLTKEFRNALEQRSADEEEESDRDSRDIEDMFTFLKQLTDQQLLHLLREETDNVAAIALAQLKSSRSAKILKQMDESRHTKILIKMGNLSDLPIETYRQVSRHLANKALDVYNMRHVSANGVQSILSLIDRLSIEEQEEYVRSIAENDIELANKVREYFVAFSDIPDVDDELLQQALNQLETDTLITALADVDEEVYEKIMRFRPEREQQLIESELSSASDVSKKEIEWAKKKILKEIRKQKSAV